MHAYGTNLHKSYVPIWSPIRRDKVFVQRTSVTREDSEVILNLDSVSNDCEMSSEGYGLRRSHRQNCRIPYTFHTHALDLK